MNLKLRTARSGIVILFAVLCIVCLSLSLAFSASFAAYAAEGENVNALPDSDGSHDLWQVHYTDDQGEQVVSLWDGKYNGELISYLDTEGNYTIVESKESDKNCFTPFRGEGVEITLKLNPDYEISGQKLSSLYDLENAVYTGNVDTGSAAKSYSMPTKVVAQPTAEGGAASELVLEKSWTIVTLCNKLVNPPKDFIGNDGSRSYGMKAEYTLLDATLGGKVVYHITSQGTDLAPIAVEVVDGQLAYFDAYMDENGIYHVEGASLSEDVSNAANENVDLINYRIRKLESLVADSNGNNAYSLTIAAVSQTKDGIYYAQTSKTYYFDVVPQTLGNSESETDLTFNNLFDISFAHTVVDYTVGDEWIQNIGLELYLGKRGEPDCILLQQGKDYIVRSLSDETKVGRVNIIIDGMGNLTGSHTISNTIRVIPAANDWETTPNIITWTYGTYNPNNNLLVGKPVLLDNDGDIKFRIVRLVKDGETVVEEVIDQLSDIHYALDAEGKSTGVVADDVATVLKNLDAGNYRLYASVYGTDTANPNPDRNYLALAEKSLDFTIFVGVNSWKAGVEPTVEGGGWITGKLESVDGLINAASEHGTPILMIYDVEDHLIYSNLPDHANTEVGDINVLKTLKAGRYYLSAEVKGTSNYAGLKTNVFFTVHPNNLPVWAVILIVAGSLGLVALVFGILHQKGVLQMLTGKVIVSMRTRANVDATLAAIRAAKVAREAEASIAAAKAREAEDAEKTKNPEDK